MINRAYDTFLSKKILSLLLIVSGLIMISTMINREIKGDDCWFGEQAYWLVKDGVVKLKSIPIIFEWESYMLVYHKMLIWMNAGVVWLFGWSVEYMRLFNLLCFGLSLYILWKITSAEVKPFRLLVLFIMIFAPLSFEKSFEIRPEVPAMLFGLGSFYFIHRYFTEKHYYQLILAGILAGLSFLAHLNSVIYCLSGFFIFILYKKDVKATLLFSLAAIPVCFIYFIPLLDVENFQEWRHNLVNWPLHSFEESVNTNVFIGFVTRLFSEHKRFFWGDQIFGMSILFFLSVIFKGKYLWKKHRLTFLFTILLMVFLGLLGSHKSPRYIMLYQPFMALTIAQAMWSLKFDKKPVLKYVFTLVLIAQLAFVGISVSTMYDQNAPFLKKHKEMFSSVPKGSKVLAPWETIYNEIDNYQIINYKTFLYVQDLENRKIDQLKLFEEASKIEIEFIIISQKAADEYDLWFKGIEVESNEFYEVHEMHDDYTVMRKRF